MTQDIYLSSHTTMFFLGSVSTLLLVAFIALIKPWVPPDFDIFVMMGLLIWLFIGLFVMERKKEIKENS